MAFKFLLIVSLLARSAFAQPSTEATTEGTKIPSAEYDVDRVIGGRNAYPGEFPHQVSLQTAWGKHMCGGSILSDRWILTAGHCISGQTIIVKAGKNNVEQRESTEQIANVERTIVHERYQGEVFPYDIALLKLSTPLKFNQYVRSIKLPARNVEPRGTAILSGWGSISRTLRPLFPSILQTGTTQLLDANSCKQMFRGYPKEAASIHYTNICTSPGVSACNGDSGGPLINANNEVIGIVSWGVIPCGGATPSVYTKVSDYVDWLRQKVSIY